MTTQPSQETATRLAARHEHISQWETRTMTCQLDARGDGTFELCVVPHSDPSLTLIERFDTPTLALRRYTDVTNRLRRDGWTVINQSAALAIRRAA